MTKAKIICDSMNSVTGNRLTTMEIEYPLYIHNEIGTHRQFSRNSASSRAVPIEKRIKRVEDDPVIPIVWPKNQPGMSASVRMEGDDAARCEAAWREAAQVAIRSMRRVAETGLHKQICNRIIEPWTHMVTLISGTQWQNFFALRTAKDAHPDLQELAYWMLDAMVRSEPRELQVGEWHIPFGDRILERSTLATMLQVSVARCARISYLTQDGTLDIAKDIELHDRLLASGHMSCFEHQASAADRSVRSGNFVGWHQYRKSLVGEERKCDLASLYIRLSAERGG